MNVHVMVPSRISVHSKSMKTKQPDYIVKLPGLGGHGVLVGEYIITAAHCLNYRNDGSMAMGDYYIEQVIIRRGPIKARPLVVEPVSDIAVLGCLDEQEFSDDAEAFEEFCNTTTPARLARIEPGIRKPIRVRIHGHDGRWIPGTATRFTENVSSICVDAESEVKGGASGGPIINPAGELVAIVSNFSIPPDKRMKATGAAPCPLLALPVWMRRRLLHEHEPIHLGNF